MSFVIFTKKSVLKFIYLFIVVSLIFSCSESEEVEPNLPKNYGTGLYIATENGISFYDGDTVLNQIYGAVNNTSALDIKRIKFKGSKANSYRL